MKIIDIQTFGVNLGDGNHIFVRVLTDEHLHDHVRAAALRIDARVEDLGDVLRLDGSARHRLSTKARDDVRALLQRLTRDDLHGDAASGVSRT